MFCISFVLKHHLLSCRSCPTSLQHWPPSNCLARQAVEVDVPGGVDPIPWDIANEGRCNKGEGDVFPKGKWRKYEKLMEFKF